MSNTYSINASVRITQPFNLPQTPSGADAETFVLDPRDHLEGVTVSNSIDSGCGRFRLDLAPGGFRGRPWTELIQPYSLVSIALHRAGAVDDQATTRKPESVLLGLIDSVEESADYSNATPERSVTIMGRSLTAVLIDHRWWFHHALTAHPGDGKDPATLIPADFRSYFLNPPSVTLLRDEAELRTNLGFIGLNPRMFEASQRSPVALIETAFGFFVLGEQFQVGQRNRPPFIRVNFADGVPLSSRLRFDAARAASSFFDSRGRVAMRFLPTDMPNSSCWDLMQSFCEWPFTELFSDTFGVEHESAVDIIARKPPWAGHIGYSAEGARVEFQKDGSRRPTAGESLFDESFGDWWQRESETVYIDGGDVIAVPSLRRSSEGKDGAYTLYEINPRCFSFFGKSVGEVPWQQLIPPIVDEDPSSPSFIMRYGCRPLTVEPQSIVVDTGDDETRRPDGDIQRHCLAYAALLYEWYHRLPAFWRGTYVLKGRTALRVGRRLVDLTRRREYYITGVVHRMTFDKEPSYTTTVQVERGWDLNPNAL